jgi:alkanesulfonate monooxygenase SsuD/methylene tetrahydromethanopterin reductase-like flavin-dependent oxidoreductase (luciferase family)
VTAPTIPIGVNPTSIGVPGRWWIDTARALESAGSHGVWCWDHFVSRGRRTDPVLECWSTLAATASRTSRVRVGSLVTNVMNRHPAVLARMLTTIHEASGGRVDLGFGIGGHPAEHEAYGIDFPDAKERVARLEEAVGVLRLLWAGGPADFSGRFYRLRGAYASPVLPVPPRIVVGGQSPGGARLAARVGDAWTTNAPDLERLLPVFEETLAENGRRREDVPVVLVVGLEKGLPPARQPIFADLAGVAAAWSERGADEIIVEWMRPRDIPWLIAAAERADLASR